MNWYSGSMVRRVILEMTRKNNMNNGNATGQVDA